MPNHVVYIPVHLEKVLASLKKEDETLTQCAKRILTEVLERCINSGSNEIEILPLVSLADSQINSNNAFKTKLAILEQRIMNLADTPREASTLPDNLQSRLETLEKNLEQFLAVSEKPLVLPESLVSRLEKIDRFQDRLDSFGEVLQVALAQVARLVDEEEEPPATTNSESDALSFLFEEPKKSTPNKTVSRKPKKSSITQE